MLVGLVAVDVGVVHLVLSLLSPSYLCLMLTLLSSLAMSLVMCWPSLLFFCFFSFFCLVVGVCVAVVVVCSVVVCTLCACLSTRGVAVRTTHNETCCHTRAHTHTHVNTPTRTHTLRRCGFLADCSHPVSHGKLW